MSAKWNTSRAWSRAFARQALSDLDTRTALETLVLSRCQHLHYLQMATEKLCKAYLYATGGRVKETHAVAAKHLPSVVREIGIGAALSGTRLKALRRLAREIDFLAPALRNEGSRQDNVEYPWMDAFHDVIAPVDFDFASVDDRQIPGLIKLLRAAASKYAT